MYNPLAITPPKKRVEVKLTEYGTEKEIFDYIEMDSLSDFDMFIANQIGSKERSLLTDNHKKLYTHYVNEIKERLNNEQWFGTPLPTSIKEVLTWKRFSKMELLAELEEKVREELKKIKRIENIQPKRRLGHNSLEIGVFDFEAAAMGLTKQRNADGQLKIVTTNPKVFAYFPKVNVRRKVISFYILAVASSRIAGDSMVYNGLSAIIMADYFIKQGYSVQINVIYGCSYKKVFRCAVVKAKTYENGLNREKIATLTSDPKFWRGKGFISLIAINNYFQNEMDESFGSPPNEKSFAPFCLNLERKNQTIKTVIIQQCFSMDACVQEVTKQITFLMRIQKYDEFSMSKYRRYYEDLPLDKQKEIKTEVDEYINKLPE